MNKLFGKKQNDVSLTNDEIAELLKVDSKALEAFNEAYEISALNTPSKGFFGMNSKEAVKRNKGRSFKNKSYDKEELELLVDRITSELLVNAGLSDSPLNHYVSRESVLKFPKEVRPQLTARHMTRDLGGSSYMALLTFYKKWLDTGDISFYHRFRQGLDLVDLDKITYDMIGMNRNTMGNWLPPLRQAVQSQDFFKIPTTTVVKMPLPILQLTRLDYTSLTQSTLKIVDDFCMKAFNLDVRKKYFVKTGTFSSKFDFRNALVQGEQEVRELGQYLLFIHHQALQMASPLNNRTIYGASTTTEWVVREFIEDLEDNPTIYKGMPLHTEYRVFVDFDNDELLGVSPYWREDVMKKSFSSGHIDDHKKHDYVIYKMHEDKLYERYNKNVDKIKSEIKKLMKNIDLKGQWSIDVMQNKNDFYIIDMSLAANSALNDVVPKEKIRKPEENWIPKLEKVDK